MKLKAYFQEAFDELVHKVAWPTWSELQNSALVVMVATVIIAIVIFIKDSVFSGLMDLIYNAF